LSSIFYEEASKKTDACLTLAWVAQPLEMGHWGCVSHLLKGKTKSANING